MQRHDYAQGSAQWLAHRNACFNASDAPAMLGCSKYETRSALLRRLATGIVPEVDAGTQRRFDDGHRFEELARPIAEQIIGEDLGRVVGSIDAGLSRPLGASFDGIDFMDDVAWEHKSLNDELRGCMGPSCIGRDLPKQYQVQMEQQCMVSGAARVLFMASKWDGDTLVEERHCWYTSDAALRAEILAGWRQFDADLAAYTPAAPAAVEKVVAEAVESLPAPFVQVTGTLALQDNFAVFENRVRDFLANKLMRNPQSDQDFANLDAQIKQMKDGREALKSARAQMLAQVDPIDRATKTVDMLDKLLQQACSASEAVLKGEKDRRREQIVTGGRTALEEHVRGLNRRLGGNYMPAVVAPFGDCVKGLKSLASMEDKVGTLLANTKIQANETADRIDANLKTLAAVAPEHAALFPDRAAIVLKAPEDLQTLVRARVSEHDAAVKRRAEEAAEKERARIRAEEEERARAVARQEQEAREAEERRERQRIADNQAAADSLQAIEEARADGTHSPAALGAMQDAVAARLELDAKPTLSTVQAMSTGSTVVPIRPAGPPTLGLGEINSRLAKDGIKPVFSEAFLAALGIEPAGKERNAPKYHEADFEQFGNALIAHIAAAQRQQQQAA